MNLVWEEEYIHEPRRIGEPQRFSITEWHLKRVWDKDPLADKFTMPLMGQWKVSLAWVRRVSEREYSASFVRSDDNDKTFRSLKAAKAYAVAIVTLEQ